MVNARQGTGISRLENGRQPGLSIACSPTTSNVKDLECHQISNKKTCFILCSVDLAPDFPKVKRWNLVGLHTETGFAIQKYIIALDLQYKKVILCSVALSLTRSGLKEKMKPTRLIIVI
jgi:hypothetical protein